MKQANPQGVLSPNGLLPAGHAIVPVDAEGWKCVCTCMDVYAHGCTQTYTHAGMHIHMNICVCVCVRTELFHENPWAYFPAKLVGSCSSFSPDRGIQRGLNHSFAQAVHVLQRMESLRSLFCSFC